MAAGHKIVPEDRVLLIGAAGVGKNSLIEQVSEYLTGGESRIHE